MPKLAPMFAAFVTDFAKIHAMKMDAVIIQGLAARPCLSSPLKNPPSETVFGESRNMTTPYTTRNAQKKIPVVESTRHAPSNRRPCAKKQGSLRPPASNARGAEAPDRPAHARAINIVS